MSDYGDHINMTREDLYEWVTSKGCTLLPIPEHKANVIFIENPKNGLEYWLNLPIDNRPVRDYTVYRTCTELGIEVPTCATYMKPLHEKIKNHHSVKKSNNKKH